MYAFEEMARRGKQTLLFGPMKPVGLTKPDGTKTICSRTVKTR